MRIEVKKHLLKNLKKRTLADILGQNIRQRRERLFPMLTQQGFAKRLDMAQQTLSRIENGHHSPHIEKLKQIADVLGTSIDDLLVDDKSQRVA